MSQTALYALIFVFAAIVAVLWPRFSKPGFQDTRITGFVRHVVDGDTLYLEGVEPAIRVWGIDAPEIKEDGYHEAKNALARLAYRKVIQYEQMDVDRYGRIVARCTLKDGRDISAEMIRGGHAVEYCRYSKGYYQTCGQGR